MTDDTSKSDDGLDQDDVLEVSTEIGPLRMRSRAEIVQQDDGSVSFEITGPFLEFMEPAEEGGHNKGGKE